MKKKILCRLGVHHPQPGDKIELYKINNNCYDVVEKCDYCGEYIKVGNIEAPIPQNMSSWNYTIINN